jgi:hypothetical protein
MIPLDGLISPIDGRQDLWNAGVVVLETPQP